VWFALLEVKFANPCESIEDFILVQLGTVEGFSPTQKPRFVSGLTELLQRLRNQKIKNFSAIASQIAAYRSKFVEGNAKSVLFLDETEETG
jgi:hypothetical protein